MAGHTELYEVLGIPVTATQQEIVQAYRLSARRLHPDKNLNDPTSTERFQLLQFAYSVLGDSKKRRRYDETGNADDESSICFEEYYEQYKHTFVEVTAEAIDEFTKTYLGSAEEQDDIAAYLERFGGDLKFFYESVPLSEPESRARYLDIIERLVADKRVKPSKKLKLSIIDFDSISNKWKKKLRKEQKSAEKRRNASEAGSSKRVKTPNGEEGFDLMLAIQQNQQRRTSRMFGIMAKYTEQQKGEAYTEPSEEEFQAARSRLSNMSSEVVFSTTTTQKISKNKSEKR